MKTIKQHSVSKFKFSISKRRFLSATSMFVMVAYINLVFGCSYYSVNTVDPLSNESIVDQAQKKGKYIILHQGGKAWHLKDVVVNEAGQELTGTVETLPSNHQYYTKAKGDHKPNRYKGSVKSVDKPIHEIHFYASVIAESPDSKLTIPFSTITKIEVYDTHVGATVFSALGVVAGVTAVIILILVASKSSCPFVYTSSDGYAYNFAGEMFGGAIYSSLERDDYMPLPEFLPTNNKYHLRISNELLERQYTNLANLLMVEHPENSTVLFDKNGGIQTITSPQVPTKAISGSNINYAENILRKDSSSYLFDEANPDNTNVSSLIVSFKRPENSTTGKLIINAKNSFWLDYAYEKFNRQFGTYFNTFMEEQKKVPAKKNIQWTIDQHIPLSVYVETQNGWKFVDYFNSIGPLAARDLVMPIDLGNLKGDEVRIKLECGFMFWEADYAAMDFTENIPVEVMNITPSSAIDERGNEVSHLITATDNKYLIQPDIGNVVTIEYPASPLKGTEHTQTVFLHSRGYYEYIREYTNWPSLNLLSFKKKGAFTKFSKEQYYEFVANEDLFAAGLMTKN